MNGDVEDAADEVAARAFVVRWLRRGRLCMLPVVQRFQALAFGGLFPLKRLPVAGVACGNLHGALLLLEPQLQRILLLLALKLLVLQRARSRVLGAAAGSSRGEQKHQQRSTQGMTPSRNFLLAPAHGHGLASFFCMR